MDMVLINDRHASKTQDRAEAHPKRVVNKLLLVFHLSHGRHSRIVIDREEIGALRPLLERSRLRIEPVVKYSFTAGEFDLKLHVESQSQQRL